MPAIQLLDIPFRRRMWRNLTQALSTSTLAVVTFGIAVPLAVVIGSSIYEAWKPRMPGVPVLAVLRDSVLSAPTLISAGITISAWVFLLAWSTVRTVRRDEHDLLSIIAERERRIHHLTESMGVMSSYEKQRDAFRDQVNVLEAQIQAKNLKIELLTWPEDRPKISFVAWGQMQPQFLTMGGFAESALLSRHGFYLVNDGGTALEIEVEDFEITKQLIAVGGTASRIESDDKGFVPVWIKDEVPLSKWAVDIALEKAWEAKVDAKELDAFAGEPLEFGVSVVYRDYNQLWYRSRATLRYFSGSLRNSRIEFAAPTQERHGLNKPRLIKL